MSGNHWSFALLLSYLAISFGELLSQTKLNPFRAPSLSMESDQSFENETRIRKYISVPYNIPNDRASDFGVEFLEQNFDLMRYNLIAHRIINIETGKGYNYQHTSTKQKIKFWKSFRNIFSIVYLFTIPIPAGSPAQCLRGLWA